MYGKWKFFTKENLKHTKFLPYTKFHNITNTVQHSLVIIRLHISMTTYFVAVNKCVRSKLLIIIILAVYKGPLDVLYDICYKNKNKQIYLYILENIMSKRGGYSHKISY